MLGEHLRQAPIGHRAFIKVGADQRHAAVGQPAVHFRSRKPPLGFLASKQAPGAMHGRIERRPCLRTVHPLDDHGIVAHGTANETALAWESRRCALPDHPQIPPVVRLPPSIVVVVVHHVGDGAADDFAYAIDHPFPARVGIAPRKLHGRDVAATKL